MELGRVTKVAAIHAKNGNTLKAVETLAASVRRVDHARPMVEYLLTGLRRSLTLGVLPASSPTASKLLVYVDQLDKGSMTEQETDEVSSSHPFDRRILHPSTSSSQCSKRSDVLITQVSARSPRLSLGWGTTLLLCCVWTMPSHRLSSYKISRFQRSRHCSPFTSTIFDC